VALDAGGTELAEQQFRAVLAATPDDAAALAGLGQVLAQRDEHSLAIRLFEAALEKQPFADQVYYLLALSLRAEGRTEEARTAMEQRGERIPFIVDPMLALMTAREQGAGPFIARALQALTDGNTDAALNALSIDLEIEPLNLDAQVTVGRALATAGDPASAVRALELVLAEDPEHRVALLNLGDLMLRAGRYAAAVTPLRKAVEIEADPLSVAMLADALMLDQQFDEAAFVYSELGGLDREPGSLEPEPYYYAGIALSATDRCGEAVAFFTLAFSRNPPLPARLEALVRSTATCADATPEQIAEILNMAEALYNNFPSQQTSETFAMAMAANDRFDDAVDLQGQAIFEALRDGLIGANPQLRENMQHYTAGEHATRPWPEGHSIYRSTLSGIGDESDAAVEDLESPGD
jgi:tetratricopeptide (TPR) repeat protein